MNVIFAWCGRLALSLANDRRGVTAIEYGLMTGLIALVIVSAVSHFGVEAKAVFTTVANTI
jgi:pilus assembly protein Flp/PilA